MSDTEKIRKGEKYMVKILLGLLILFSIVFAVFLLKDVFTHKDEWEEVKPVHNGIIGFVANFFDTLGIGSFAIATSYWKITKSLRDDLVPGTLNVCFALCVVTEALVFIQKVECDSVTLVTMIVASCIGAVVGAKFIVGLDINKIRFLLGVCLIIVAVIMSCKNAGIGPFGMIGTATGVSGVKLIIAIVVNFILGGLMMCGIGLYAPCMALVLLLDMSTATAFPIMMGSCAFLMIAGGFEFVKAGKYARGNCLWLLIPGIIGVLVACFIITSLPLKVLTYLVCIVLLYCGYIFIKEAKAKK